MEFELFKEEGVATHLVFLLGQFHGQRSLVGYSHKQMDRTEQLTLSVSKRIVVYLVAGLKYLIQESMSVFPKLGFDVFPDTNPRGFEV